MLLGGVTYILVGFDNFTGTHVVMMVFGFLTVILVYLVGFAWSLIGWHRFVLLEERPNGFLPKRHSVQVKIDIFNLFRVFCIVFLAIAVLSFMTYGFGLVVYIPLLPYLLSCGIRISLGLPSRAIDGRFGVSEVWAATKPIAKNYIGFPVFFAFCVLNQHFWRLTAINSNN